MANNIYHRLFYETNGGSIVSAATGLEVVKINVAELALDDARRVRDAVMAALEAEFSRKN